jgi:hypothetical protein
MADEFITKRQEGLDELVRESEQPIRKGSLPGEGEDIDQPDTIKEVSYP